MQKKRVLIVNCYFDETRRPVARVNKFPQAMAPVYLAGTFSKELCDVRMYSELPSGPLQDKSLIGWPDMLVLTGLTTSFDRMLHLTASARTENPKVIVVAGGPAIRALPKLSARYFDYVCEGDVEQMEEVIRDAFGSDYIQEEMVPRFDLAYWVGRIGYAETSRNCNFRCAFCTLTAEGKRYTKLSLDSIRKEILAAGKKRMIVFLDNNFYGNDRNYFLARLDVIRSLWKQGQFTGWAALVTNDFFFKDENIRLARESGCQVLFNGVESFDTGWLQRFKKIQDGRISQVGIIKKCLEAGIVFQYGMMLDPFTRSVRDLRKEVEFILSTPEISLPSYLSIPVPILGTPFFYECLKKKAILPLTKLRDLDTTTLSMAPQESMDEAVAFVRDIHSLRGYRRQILQHTAGFLKRYRTNLNCIQLLIHLGTVMNLSAPALFAAPTWFKRKRRHSRTHVSTTEPLDEAYTPPFPVSSQYESYFNPTMVTDADGSLTVEMSELLERHSGIRRSAFPESPAESRGTPGQAKVHGGG